MLVTMISDFWHFKLIHFWTMPEQLASVKFSEHQKTPKSTKGWNIQFFIQDRWYHFEKDNLHLRSYIPQFLTGPATFSEMQPAGKQNVALKLASTQLSFNTYTLIQTPIHKWTKPFSVSYSQINSADKCSNRLERGKCSEEMAFSLLSLLTSEYRLKS